MGRTRGYIGLGANVGDPRGTLAAAVAAIDDLPGVRVVAVSPLYRSAPVGVTDQPDFLNAVAAVDVDAARLAEGAEDGGSRAAVALLVGLKRIERASGRVHRSRWGPRELDLDLLLLGRSRLALATVPAGAPDADEVTVPAGVPFLELPHRSMGERRFVLEPLADLAPRLVPPGWRETVATAARRLADERPEDAVERIAGWDATEGAWR